MDYEYLYGAVGGTGADGRGRAGVASGAGVRDWVIGALREVADGSRPTRAVTHPLGFTCLPIERTGPEGVCVHVWSPRLERAAPTTSAIHAHCWELTSYALFGQLANTLMVLADAAGRRGRASLSLSSQDQSGDEGELYRVLEVRSASDIDELVPTSRLVYCVPVARQVISAGDVYSVAAGVFHSTKVAPGTEAATVVLGRVVPGVPDRSLGRPDSGPHVVRRRRCGAEQTAAAARVVLDRLLAATACQA
jgi:hypothetical protein